MRHTGPLNLGDLPRDIARERGEHHQGRGNSPRLPSDMRSVGEKQSGLENAPLGSPVQDYDVRSVFDSRPVNGFDFNQSFSANITPYAGGNFTNFGQSMVVPAGYIAVLREIEFFQPFTAGALVGMNAAGYDLEVFITRDGAVISPLSIPAGATTSTLRGILVRVPGTIHTFQVFNELETIGANFISFILSVTPLEFSMTFKGSMLMSTGIPPNVSVANPKGARGL